MSTQQFNRDVAGWGRNTKGKLKIEVLRTISRTGPGYKQINVGVKQYMGEASKIDFSFAYYMIFVHKGAGRGYGGVKSGKFTTKSGKKGITSPLSFGKMGTGKRIARPWFNPIIDQQFPVLADLIANYHGEKAILNIQKILIK